MNLDDFVVPQYRLNIYDYNLKRFEIHDTSSKDLKKLLNSTTNISNVLDTIQTLQDVKRRRFPCQIKKYN